MDTFFGKGINTLPFFHFQLLDPPFKNTMFGTTKCTRSPPQPTKDHDLQIIEGEGLDLHPHQSGSLSPLICLRD
jgi:hypothetical protein